MASYAAGSGDDARREMLDTWAVERGLQVQRSAQSGRCSIFVGGQRETASRDDFHDAVGTAYQELVLDLRRRPALGTVDGAPSAMAIRGLANRRLVSRIIDGRRRGSKSSPGVDVLTLKARRRPGTRTAPGADAVFSEGPLHARLVVLDLRDAAASLSPSDSHLLARTLAGHEPSELAEHLQITELAARQRLFRARRRLAAKLAA